MRHRKDTFKIGRTGAHRRSLLANQVCSLIFEGQIETTVVKAKQTRRLAEKMVTLGKKGRLHHRRLAIAKLHNPEAVKALFDEVAPKFAKREGGYTRIIRIGQRRGDAAETCLLQWVDDSAPIKRGGRKTSAAEKDAAEAGASGAAEAAPAPA